jgi:hypothetical protein
VIIRSAVDGVGAVLHATASRNAEFRGSLVAVQGGAWGGHTFLETSTHAFPIFSCIFNGFFMFDLLLLFRFMLPGGVAWPFWLFFSVIFYFWLSPFWVGASVW